MFQRGDLLKPSLDAVIIRRLSRQLCEMFEKPPGILSNPSQDVQTFLDDLTDKVGPQFSVLDEIGAAFEVDRRFNRSSMREVALKIRSFGQLHAVHESSASLLLESSYR